MRATVIKSLDAATALPAEQTPVRRAVIVRRAVVEANERATAILAQAHTQAQATIANAEREAAVLKQAAAETGRAEGYAEAMARAAILGQMEATADQRALDRTIILARLLAERLLGKGLQIDAETVVALAQQALNELTGVRQVRLLANPVDVAVLQSQLGAAQPGFTPSAGFSLSAGFSIVAESTLGRGDFRIVTDAGTIEASMGDRLDLLATKLRDSLKKGA